jgi:hypothetical protein
LVTSLNKREIDRMLRDLLPRCLIRNPAPCFEKTMMTKQLIPTAIAFVWAAGASLVFASGGFLFTTFNGEADERGEQIYFALSRDGRSWEALNHAEPVLTSSLGEKGVRDPFLLRAHDGSKFYLLATDLSVFHNRDWKRAVQKGSRSIVIWESADLVKWSEPRLVNIAPDDAGCTWAPEAVYNTDTGEYLVFWASATRRDHFAKQRIWAARTTDFKTFGAPFIYIERPTQVIDTDIVRDGGKYYRFSKDEQFKAITMEVSEKLMGPWRNVPGFSLSGMIGYEGPECYLMESASGDRPATWCLILDYYAKGKGYQPFVTHDLAGGEFVPGESFHFPFRFRHGSILSLSDEEYRRLEQSYGK